MATAVFAGGCFWGIEGVYEHVKGVKKAVSGYAGGPASTAHYDLVSSGETGHAESVQVTYDPAQISYGKLLQIFFAVAHDPTELDRQGPDEGTQYRSAIFFASAEQERVARAYIAQLDAAKAFSKPICDAGRSPQGFLPGGGLSPALSGAKSDVPVHLVQRPPKDRATEAAISGIGNEEIGGTCGGLLFPCVPQFPSSWIRPTSTLNFDAACFNPFPHASSRSSSVTFHLGWNRATAFVRT